MKQYSLLTMASYTHEYISKWNNFFKREYIFISTTHTVLTCKLRIYKFLELKKSSDIIVNNLKQVL